MFYSEPNAGKAALGYLTAHLAQRGFVLFDCQMVTNATEPLGAAEIARKDYLAKLAKALRKKCSFT